MNEKKIIAVVGATGAQGGGLCRAVLEDGSGGYRVRALTRNASSDKAKELKKLGAEVVEVDIDDVESLKRAFEGADGAFCVTFFWEHFSPEKELAEAKNMADAAKHAGVRHVIWSTLEDTRNWVPLSDSRMPTLQGKYKVPHFDAKGEANRLFSERGLPTTFLLTSFYWENLIYFGMGPKRGPDGNLYITFPMGDKKLPGIAAGDIGKCAYAIFRKGREFIGKTVGIAGDHLTGGEMAAALTKALGVTVRYNDVTPEVFRGFGFPGADDLGNMFQFKRDFEPIFCGARNPEFSRALNPSMQTFAAWLVENGDRIPIEKGTDTLEIQLKEWGIDLDKLKHKASKAKDDASTEIDREVAALRGKLNEAQKKLEELKTAGDAASVELKKGVEGAWAELKKGLESAAAKFKS